MRTEVNKKNIVIGILIGIIIILTSLLVLFVTNTIRFNTDNENKTDIQKDINENINKNYQGIYGFKIQNDTIYALLSDNTEKTIINFKNIVCGESTCGTIQFEYIDGKLYLYAIGEQDATYNVNKNKQVTIYSLDLSKDEIALKKEYDIDKQDRYVASVRQTNDAFYYIAYDWDNEEKHYVSKIFKFDKLSQNIQEIYDFKGYATTGQYGVFAINNQNLYVECDISYGQGSNDKNQLLQINLNSNESKVIYEDISLSYYDSVSKKIISSVNDNDIKNTTLRILDLNDLSSELVTTKQISNQFYSIHDILVYHESNNNVINIMGKNNYSIDLTEYVSGTIEKGYTRLELSENYSVKVYVYLENESTPQVYIINIKTGNISKIDFTNDEAATKYIYIK